MNVPPPPAVYLTETRAVLAPIHTGGFDAQIARCIADTSAWFATHPRRPAGPSQDDLEHPTRAPMCQGSTAMEHAMCGGIYATQLGDADCTCPCHPADPQEPPC